jgi:hypothetical protein
MDTKGKAANLSSPELQQILEQRRKVHGDWAECASVSQRLKALMFKNHGLRDESANEAIGNICQKLARIAVGKYFEPDHWLDIAGYATLQYNILRNEKAEVPRGESL